MSNYNNKNSKEEEIMEVDKNININDFKTKTKENVHKDFKVTIPTNEKNFSTLISPENLQSTRFSQFIKKDDEINNSDSDSINNISEESEIQIITYTEVFNYFMSLYLSKKSEIPEEKKIEICCLCKIFGKYSKISNLNKELIEEKKFILFSNSIPYSYHDNIHMKVLYSIYIQLNKNNSNKNHTNKIELEKELKTFCFYSLKSFNNSEKNIILESLNMTIKDINILSLIQLLYIIDLYPSFININFNNIYDILFFSIHLSKISFEQIKKELLNNYCNKKKSVIDIFNQYYIGLFELGISYLIKNEFKNKYKSVIKILRQVSEKDSKTIFLKFDEFKKKYPEEKENNSFTGIFNNSTSKQ